jgi:thioredoxin-related protein
MRIFYIYLLLVGLFLTALTLRKAREINHRQVMYDMLKAKQKRGN